MKINFTPDQRMLLERFARDMSPEATLIKAILKQSIKELGDINNIDPKGNMGLQALGHQLATQKLLEIFVEIFPDLGPVTTDTGKKISQYR